MRICPYCGSTVEDGGQFCANCGTPMPPPQAAQQTVYCPNCGELIPANLDVCPNCGASLWTASTQGDPQQYGQQPYDPQQYGQQPYDPQQYGQQPYDPQQYGQQPLDPPPYNPQPGEQKPAGKKTAGKKLVPIIIGAAAGALALVAVVVVAAILIIPRLFSSPSKQFISYHEKLFVTALLSGLEDGVDRAESLSTVLTITDSTDKSSIER